MRLNRAVFLDRDGVIIKDMDCIVRADQIQLIEGAQQALVSLKEAGFLLVIVSNQPVVARGVISEAEIVALNDEIERRFIRAGGCAFDGFYFCPHHPNATLEEYRIDCTCRKPSPGLLLQAAAEKSIDLKSSFMVGDRITDIIAGKFAGCTTIQVLSGMHEAAAIATKVPIDMTMKADHISEDLAQAAAWILRRK